MLRKWNKLPKYMQCQEVRAYYDVLEKRKSSIFLKRCLDFVLAFFLLIILAIPMFIIAGLIKCDSSGSVFYRQERVTAYGKVFKIHKFRTMVTNADKIGTQVTIENDKRVTRIGKILRKYRLDELPQLLDVLHGDMSFVGTRPESTYYVTRYTNEMFATLLLPAGITSEASIRFKDEAVLLSGVDDVDAVYVEKVLPLKMKYNLDSIMQYNLLEDIKTMFRTVLAVLGKEYT